MKKFNILNNNTIVTEEVISAKNPDSSNSLDITTNTFLAPMIFRENPVTSLSAQLSGFTKDYWEEYNLKWLDLPYTDSVIFHTQNHYRTVALNYLKRENCSAVNISKTANILTGFPFTIISGIVDIVTEGDNYLISQYAFYDTLPTDVSPTYSYKIPTTFDLCISAGEIVDWYAPIVSGLFYYDCTNNGNFWLESEFDMNYDAVDEYFFSKTNYDLHRNKFVGLITDAYLNVNFNFSFFEKYMATHFPKNLYLFFRQHYADSKYEPVHGNSFIGKLLTSVSYSLFTPLELNLELAFLSSVLEGTGYYADNLSTLATSVTYTESFNQPLLGLRSDYSYNVEYSRKNICSLNTEITYTI